MKRLIFRLGAVLLTLMLLCGAAQAEGVLSRNGSISVHIRTAEGENVPEAQIELYRVGDPDPESNSLAFVLSAAFAGSGIALDDLHGSTAADALNAYIEAQNVTPDAEQVTGMDGRVHFADVPCGLYLVRQNGFYGEGNGVFIQIAQFVVSVPMMNESGTGWIYDIQAQPKANPATEPGPSIGPGGPPGTPVETDPPEPTFTPAPTNTPPPSEPSLPQTGMLRWPIPVLGVSGLVVFAAGWALAFGKRKDQNA